MRGKSRRTERHERRLEMSLVTAIVLLAAGDPDQAELSLREASLLPWEEVEEEPFDPRAALGVAEEDWDVGLEGGALFAKFDTGNDMQEHWGWYAGLFGEYRSLSNFRAKAGYRVFDTEVDEVLHTPRERNARLHTLFGQFQGSFVNFKGFLEFGGILGGGLHRFHHREDNDSAPFVELGLFARVSPLPWVYVEGGILRDWTQSSFNRKHTHLDQDSFPYLQKTYPLGKILVDRGVLSGQQLKALLRLQQRLANPEAAAPRVQAGVRECANCFEVVPIRAEKCPKCGNFFGEIRPEGERATVYVEATLSAVKDDGKASSSPRDRLQTILEGGAGVGEKRRTTLVWLKKGDRWLPDR
jgi:hypothetical protein